MLGTKSISIYKTNKLISNVLTFYKEKLYLNILIETVKEIATEA